MTDRLLGTPPDQITESEKLRRLAEIAKKLHAIDTKQDGWIDEYGLLRQAENEVERRYPDLPPEAGPVTVASISMFTGACPTQWEGKTSDDKDVYARYRHGYLSVEIDGQPYFGKQLDYGDSDDEQRERYLKIWGEEESKKMLESHLLMKKFSGGFISYHGVLSFEQLKEATLGWIVWPEEPEEEEN